MLYMKSLMTTDNLYDELLVVLQNNFMNRPVFARDSIT